MSPRGFTKTFLFTETDSKAQKKNSSLSYARTKKKVVGEHIFTLPFDSLQDMIFLREVAPSS